MDLSTPRSERARQPLLPRAACAGVAVVACIVIFGWIFDVPILICGLPRAAGMNPVTASCLLVLSAALWTLLSQTHNRWTRPARLAACLVSAIGAARLLAYFTAFPFTLDQISYRSPVTGGMIPSRVAANTSLALALLGISLATLHLKTRWGWRPSQIPILMTLAISLVTLMGYLYGVPALYGTSHFVAMAPHTGFSLLLLSIGALFARTDSGLARLLLSPAAGGVSARRILPLAILTPIVLGWLRLESRKAGVLGSELSSALLGLVIAGVFVALIWITGRALDQSDGERLRALSDAERHRLFLDTVIEHLPHMVFVKDARELRFVRFNRAGEDLLGYSRQDLVGKNDYDFFPRDEADFFIAKDRAVLETRLPLLIPEEPIQTRERGARILRTTKVPVLDEAGQPVYLLGISEDITEMKQGEAREKELNRSVRRHAARLEAVNQELEAFSYSVSHDLRAPLRHVGGFADLLQRHAAPTLDERGKRYLLQISESARSMGQLIDDLLVFSRMGRQEMREAEVDLDDMIREVRKDHASELEGRNVRWQIAPLGLVRGDAAMLRQAFANLISNAVKYTSKRSQAEIEIGIQPSDAETIVFVRDNGAGFDMNYAHKLFGVFQRLHSGQEFPGTGIGLANVRRVIQRHGGRTWAEGKPDGGATVYVTLPRTGNDDSTWREKGAA